MTTPSRSVGLELTVANKPQFLTEMEEIAQQVNSLFKINLPGGSGLPSAPSMPTPPSQEATPPSYLGTVNPTVPVQPAQSQSQLHQQTVGRMPNGVPTTVPQSQSNAPGNALGQFGHGYHRFRHVTGTLLPMYGSLLGVEAIGSGYQTASSLAVQAGQIGMNTGGVSPDKVFGQLTTMGKSQAIAPSQLAQTVQLQGQFSGTSNMAFLFRDSMQTAMFARALGVSNTQATQVMGSYQLSGAFQSGQEAGTAAQIAAAAKVSGMNSSAFMQGVQTLAQLGQRTGVETGGGVATSLAMVNRLGASLNMPLLQNANGVQTLQTLQQGWSAGPGAQSGLYASQMLPLYSAVEKSMAPVYKKMGFGGMPELASLMQTNISDYPQQMLAPLLTAMHKELTAPGMTGTAKQMTELGMSQFLFGNINASSLQNISKLAQTGPGFNLTATEKAIKDAQGTLKTNNQTYLGSIAGDVSKIQTTVESILAKIGGTAIKAGAAVAPAAGAHPGLTGALTVGAGLATTFTPYLMMRRFVGGGGAFGGGLTSAAGAGAGDAAIGTGLATGALAAGTSLAAGLALIPWNKKDVQSVPKTLAQAHDSSLYSLGRFGPGVNDNFTHVAETSLAAGGHPSNKTTLSHTSAYQLGRFGPGMNDNFTQAAQQSLATRMFPVHVSVTHQTTPMTPAQQIQAAGGPNWVSNWAGVGSGPGLLSNFPAGPILPAPNVTAASSIAGGNGGVGRYATLINAMSKKYGDPANYLAGIMQTESSGNPYSLHDNKTGKSYTFSSLQAYLAEVQALKGHSLDMGLMQINNMAHPGVTATQAANPSFALQFAANLLKADYNATGSWDKAIQAYNGGLGGVGSRQTQDYLANVLQNAAKFSAQKPRPSAQHNMNRKAQSSSGAGSRARMTAG